MIHKYDLLDKIFNKKHLRLINETPGLLISKAALDQVYDTPLFCFF